MSGRDKAFHLMVGLLLVLGYFASTPAHIWQPDNAVLVPPEAGQAGPRPGQPWTLRAASDAITPLVHAGSMVELPDGRLRAFWFAGRREGGPDVGIHSAVFDPATGQWSPEQRLFDRHRVAQRFGYTIRKLGNALPVMSADGRMRLFVVAVSFGGWAASRLVVAESTDLGESWVFTDDLVLSPFLDLSYLVKTPPVRYSDGTIGLPVYHEFAGKFGELLRLTPDNRIIDRYRIGHGRAAIQPLVLVRDDHRAVAFLRNETRDRAGRVFFSASEDAGRSWAPLEASEVPGPSAALGGISLGPDHWLLGANFNAYERDELHVVESRDAGASWQVIRTLADRETHRLKPLQPEAFRELLAQELKQFVGIADPATVLNRAAMQKCTPMGCEFQYDYPFVLRTRNGDIHVLYTWNKSLIAHAYWRAGGEAQ